MNDQDIVIKFEESENIQLSILPENDTLVEFNDIVRIESTHNHNELNNLDYEHSGHTGFASSQELSLLSNRVTAVEHEISLLDNKYINKDLSILPSVSANDDRSKMSIYIDNNGTPSKANLKDTLGTLLRLGDEMPSDMQKGEYLFLDLTLKGLKK